MEVLQFLEKEFGIALREYEFIPRNLNGISSIVALVCR
jgi:acyl carrier protein